MREELGLEVFKIIKDTLYVNDDDIRDCCYLKEGMTNKSFSFLCGNDKYIMRIPGEGTDTLINRHNERDVYFSLKGKGICDDVVYINPDNGYKITIFYNNARVCNSDSIKDIKHCMKHLRRFHKMKLQVKHSFDVFQQLEFYEMLWDGHKSRYKDYLSTKGNIMSLKAYIEDNISEMVLCHIDSVSDNFLFVKDETGKEQIKLIDWEYAGMADPHIDVAMFCIYSMFEKNKIDQVIDAYFIEGCPQNIRIKIYCYIAVCGLLWSNWCEYKRILGVEFGEYAQKQYDYAKDYFQIVQRELCLLEG